MTNEISLYINLAHQQTYLRLWHSAEDRFLLWILESQAKRRLRRLKAGLVMAV